MPVVVITGPSGLTKDAKKQLNSRKDLRDVLSHSTSTRWRTLRATGSFRPKTRTSPHSRRLCNETLPH
jgi:predicted component of type VI protein secretion system